jgi:hypothetical protein
VIIQLDAEIVSVGSAGRTPPHEISVIQGLQERIAACILLFFPQINVNR